MVQNIFDEVHAFDMDAKETKLGGRLVARVPITEVANWKREYRSGPHLDVSWDVFVTGKLNDFNNRKLRIGGEIPQLSHQR